MFLTMDLRLHDWFYVAINKKKIQDVRKLTEYTRGYEDFYESILQWPTTDAADNPDGLEMN